MMAPTSPLRHPASCQRGFVLVAVLWLIAVLAALAVIFSVHLSNSARALALNDTELQAEALVAAAVELTAYRIWLADEQAPPQREDNQLPRTRSRPPRGAFQAQLGGAELFVAFVSEAARIDLNAAPKELLAGLMAVLGASSDQASQHAERIVGWRSRATAETSDREDSLYLAAGRTYAPRKAPFAHVNELALVLGLPPALVERALPFVTVFSGMPGVDALNAPPEVVAALPGMTPLRLKQFLNDRGGLASEPAAVAAALGVTRASVAAAPSEAYRLAILVRLASGREFGSEVVISMRDGEDPFRVLSWQDATAAQTRRPAAM
ncbi:general secretion pathway protein GspK [Bradyrhizobium sp. HKCCYLS20291]|uniref:general secretion pathway protein GspK n=1 Tax=Bradyrhizobium sp. HKCCYLS20291 TaxID=3420766 RepID=UPI003EBAE8D6